MKVTVKYFASIREAIGQSSETLETSALTLGVLRDELLASSARHSVGLARGKAIRISLNHIMSDESAPISEGCEVGFFPPVTGG